MSGPSLYFLAMVVCVTLGMSFLSFTLVKRVFRIYRHPKVAYAFWIINIIALLGVAFGRGRLDIFPFSDLLVQLVVIWFMGHFFSLLAIPFYFLLKKCIIRMFSVKENAVDSTRRNLIKAAALSLPIATFGFSVYGSFYGSKTIHTLKHDVRLPKLDAALENFKIAQISDAHIGLFFSTEKLREVIMRLSFEKPDILVITGDLIDDVLLIDQTVEVLNEFAGEFLQGIYFSWGNHEYFRNFPAIKKALEGSKVKVLRNQSEILIEAKRPLYLLGVDYPWAKEAEQQKIEYRRMTAEALQNVPEESTKILLSHHPDFIDYAYEGKIDLTITGHTHGGQVAILGQTLLPVRYKYMRGMYRNEDQYGYVSTGAGSWFPFRLGCPAEVAIFTLKHK